MSTSDDTRRKSPADRFRSILSAEQGKEELPAPRKFSKGTISPNLNLPKARPKDEPGAPGPTAPTAAAFPHSAAPARSSMDMSRFLPTFWTVASVISLVVNVVLLILVITLLRTVGSLNAASLGSGVLGGLYTNFERMDQAHIKTDIPIQTDIPLNMSIPVQTTTGITLARDVTISGAHVKINTALFNIDAPAAVTLPAGTALDVTMNFTLPVQAQVPVSMNVPVDIPLHDTELHPAITGLEQTLKPLYCLVTPDAQSLNGKPVCR